MAITAYKVPGSMDEAVQMLASGGAKALAGGTDLIIQSRSQGSPALQVVDIKQLDGMMSASVDDTGLKLGPAMSCAEFTARQDIKALFPGLVEAAYLIGSSQVQGRCSVGGNLCNASPAADTIPSLIVNNAQCIIQGPDGERSVTAEDFVTGVSKNCLAPGELLTQITIAKPANGSSDAYLRFIPRTEMDIAVAGAAVSLTIDESGVCTQAKVAIGAVAPTALLVPAAAEALIGTTLDDNALENAAIAASDASKPISDRRGTVEFRRHVVGVLVKRAAKIAAQRIAQQNQQPNEQQSS